MTEAYAIKGPDGTILHVEPNESEAYTWHEFVFSQGVVLTKTAEDFKAEGFSCVPVTVSENTTPTCQNCGATSWADFYRGSSVIASVCKKCDHKITPPVTAVSEKGEAEALLKEAREDLFRLGGDSAMAYEHGDSVSRKEANDEASAIHARIDAYLSRGQG